MRSHWLWILFMLPLAACGLTDGATRIAYAIESGVSALDAAEGSRHELVGITPAQGGECVGPYKAQFDQVGALIVWCFDATGAIKSIVERLRRKAVPLATIAGWPALDRERAARLLNALYLQSGLIVSRTMGTSKFSRSFIKGRSAGMLD